MDSFNFDLLEGEKKIVPKAVKSYMERILKVTRTLEKLV